jgi:uncharacterized membrane protein
MRLSQLVRYHVDRTTPARSFRSGLAGAITFPEPHSGTVDLCRVDRSRGIYAEVALHYGDTPESAAENPDDNQSPDDRVRPDDPGSLPPPERNAGQTSPAKLLPGNAADPVSGNDGGRPVNAHPPVGSQGIRELVREEIQAHSWSGPLPPPKTLREYDEICPGATERIFLMSERSVFGMIDIEETAVKGQIEIAKTSLSAAYRLTLLAFAASVVAFFIVVNQVAGIAFVSFPVMMLIRSFLIRPDRNEPAGNATPSQ